MCARRARFGRIDEESDLIRLLGSRGASAVMGFLMLALLSSEASAQALAEAAKTPAFDIASAVKATDSSTRSLGQRNYSTAPAVRKAAAPTAVAAVEKTIPIIRSNSSTAVSSTLSLAVPAGVLRAAAPVSSAAAPAIAREATWLFRNGWPLYALVDRYGAGAPLDEQANCMAVAVYHEARGETVEGQLAVARVIMNRAASGKYPPSWCGTVKQPWQFSFVNPRTGQMPGVNVSSAAWRKAQAITRLAVANVVPSLSNDVLWYHADYVAPSWGRRLSFVSKIGTHIFYRS
jgi:N-acetylmuramoyl-L-alanine amidase